MAGDRTGPLVNADKRNVDWWWYKGNGTLAIKYSRGGTSSVNFKKQEGLVSMDSCGNINPVAAAQKSSTAMGALAASHSMAAQNQVSQKQQVQQVLLKQQQNQQIQALKNQHELKQIQLNQQQQGENTKVAQGQLTNAAVSALVKQKKQQSISDANALINKQQAEQKASIAAAMGNTISSTEQLAAANNKMKIETAKRNLQVQAAGGFSYSTGESWRR